MVTTKTTKTTKTTIPLTFLLSLRTPSVLHPLLLLLLLCLLAPSRLLQLHWKRVEKRSPLRRPLSIRLLARVRAKNPTARGRRWTGWPNLQWISCPILVTLQVTLHSPPSFSLLRQHERSKPKSSPPLSFGVVLTIHALLHLSLSLPLSLPLALVGAGTGAVAVAVAVAVAPRPRPRRHE